MRVTKSTIDYDAHGNARAKSARARSFGTEAGGEMSALVERSKLIVQTLLKRAGQLDAKKYGDRIDLEHSGEIAIKRVVTDL